MDNITFEEWQKLDLRIGKVLSVERVPETEKLYKLTVDIGPEQPIQILSSLVPFHEEKDLIGKQITVLINLEPRMMKGLESQGMLLAAGDQAVLLIPEKEIEPGTKIF